MTAENHATFSIDLKKNMIPFTSAGESTPIVLEEYDVKKAMAAHAWTGQELGFVFANTVQVKVVINGVTPQSCKTRENEKIFRFADKVLTLEDLKAKDESLYNRHCDKKGLLIYSFQKAIKICRAHDQAGLTLITPKGRQLWPKK